MKIRAIGLAIVVILAVVGGASYLLTHNKDTTDARPISSSTASKQKSNGDTSGLPSIEVAKLPKEAHNTLKLIDAGGPFPYDKDGSTYHNRNKVLPSKNAGYYKEYTVDTPGSKDRGARRIVCGTEKDCYYTADHYDSFARIQR